MADITGMEAGWAAGRVKGFASRDWFGTLGIFAGVGVLRGLSVA